MELIWGIIMILIGLFILVSSLIKSEFVIYKLLAGCAKILWGKNAHRFLSVSGILIIFFGILMLTEVIG